MSEEEKEAIDILQNCIADYVIGDFCCGKYCPNEDMCKENDCPYETAIDKVVALIEKQQKELEQEKEKIKILEIEKLRLEIQILEYQISQTPDTAMVYYSLKTSLETAREQLQKLYNEFDMEVKDE